MNTRVKTNQIKANRGSYQELKIILLWDSGSKIGGDAIHSRKNPRATFSFHLFSFQKEKGK